MSDFTEEQIIKNKVKAVNALHQGVNTVVPEINALLAAGYKTKQDGSFGKKINGKLNVITNHAPFRATVRRDHGTPTLSADITYQVGDHTCSYYGVYIQLERDFERYPIYTVDEVVRERARKEILLSKISKLETEIFKLKTLEG